ncbi:hypothetical protein D0865_15874 [Hortaea werneckii]|uniref:Dolichyl-diphosphooligosaccharide--protein glycosyltransferase subunit 4 n=1 Tax=Hortaea werneckii TaxID=91943 RepID=A0A3M7AKM8_HORWE|nr:hypothetical protein D0865_15874 [Hortaea werneckii]
MTAAGESVALGNLSPLGPRLPNGRRLEPWFRRELFPSGERTSGRRRTHWMACEGPTPGVRLSITMISDASLYSLAIFLGSASMLMIVLYHFLEINAQDPKEPLTSERKADALPAKAR